MQVNLINRYTKNVGLQRNTTFPTHPKFNVVSFLKYSIMLKEFTAGHKLWLAFMERSHSWKASSCCSVQGFSMFCRTRSFIVVFTEAHYLSISWARGMLCMLLCEFVNVQASLSAVCLGSQLHVLESQWILMYVYLKSGRNIGVFG